MPDGSVITIGSVKFRCPEVLFQPDMAGNEFGGIHHFCDRSIQKADFDIRKQLYSNIILSGGNTIYEGLPIRLLREVQRHCPPNNSSDVRLYATDQRKDTAWIGGSIITSINTFNDKWITKGEFEESGAAIVHKKSL